MKKITELEALLNDSNITEYEEMAENYLAKLNKQDQKVTYKQLAAILLLSEAKKSEKANNKKSNNKIDDIKFSAKKDTIYQRFFITLGKKDNISKLDIVEFIKSKVDGIATDDFADVYLLDTYSFFELEASKKDEVIKKIDNTKYKNHEVHIEFSEMRKPGNKSKFVKHDGNKFYKS